MQGNPVNLAEAREKADFEKVERQRVAILKATSDCIGKIGKIAVQLAHDLRQIKAEIESGDTATASELAEVAEQYARDETSAAITHCAETIQRELA